MWYSTANFIFVFVAEDDWFRLRRVAVGETWPCSSTRMAVVLSPVPSFTVNVSGGAAERLDVAQVW